MPYNETKSKAFLFGLYVGLTLLLFVSHFDPKYDSALHKVTNVYGLQALAGAVLGFWRIRKRADNPGTIPAVASVFICFGLALWAIGQGLWIFGTFTHEKDPYPWWSDIFYIAADLSWLTALFMMFKSLGRRALIESSPFLAIVTTTLGLLVYCIIWINSSQRLMGDAPMDIFVLACDLIYNLLTFSCMILAIALLRGDNAELPLPVHQCIRYLSAATAINACAIFAFTVTIKPKVGEPLKYFNGNWVDWLLLTAMYCWGVSALKCPIREEELQYTYGTRRSGLEEEDIYQASEIAESYAKAAHGTEQKNIYTDSIRWILDTIPGCWRVVKLGDLVIGSTFIFPVPRQLMESFLAGNTTEREMFEEVKRNPLTWDCLYLADANILANHRKRGLAFTCFRITIENIAKEHRRPQIEVYCWPNTLDRKSLAEKLQKHFENQNIRIIRKD